MRVQRVADPIYEVTLSAAEADALTEFIGGSSRAQRLKISSHTEEQDEILRGLYRALNDSIQGRNHDH